MFIFNTKNAKDWASLAALFGLFYFVLEPAEPFYREFKLSDHTLQHPFAVKERVTDNQLYIVSAVMPFALMIYLGKGDKELEINILGLLFSLASNAVLTDLLKNWIGRPRPDFLQRCGALAGTALDEFVTISVCTAPLGETYLKDGMKSTPSGHSSISFSGLLFFYLWLFRKYKLKKSRSIYKHCFCFIPLVLCIYIAISRTQDYRHHFIDIILGSAIGIIIASVSFRIFLPIEEYYLPK